MVRYQPPMDWQHWVEWLAAGLHGKAANANGRVAPAVRKSHHRMDQNW